MKRQISVRQYRTIDLALFTLMLLIFETVVTLAGARWFPREAYQVSVVGALTAVVMVRWGAWAALTAVLGGLLHSLLLNGRPDQIAVWSLGNLLCLAALPLVRTDRSEHWRQSTFKVLGFGALVLLLQQTGRALLAFCLGWGLGSALGIYVTDVISMLFTLLIMLVVRKLDGVMENQEHYLTRVQREEQESDEGGFR